MNIATRVAAATALTVAASWLGGCAAPAGDENATTKTIATLTPPADGTAPVAPAAGGEGDGYRMPTPADFTGELKIKELSCFGSAGCNVTAEVKLSWPTGIADPSKTYDVTYEITGADDAQTGTVQVTGEQYDAGWIPELFLSVGSKAKAKKMAVTVTTVEEA